MEYILGQTNEEINVNTAEENREIIYSLVKQARHSIHIFTQDMDDALYDTLAFKELIIEFASHSGNPELRILTQDLDHALRNSHRLIRLSQELSSFIFIRVPCDVFKSEKGAFITVDGVGMLNRADGSRDSYHASANFMNPPRAQELNHFFTEMWEQAESDPHARQLFI
jgi:hypothetical protein